ncbi:hypothetical protein IFM89_002531 [Coptis chinensis]|uniref:Uncharacterized protein n=1 Tax=Coptis chinensis TaxID=261450 RepID=A0A835HND1_9MAGN|nr:hypothetical protein IFM89_002531 [Coptis chinensis]
MGKGRPRSVEKGVLGQNSQSLIGALNIPQGPTFYPNEEEFEDPLKFIYKIRPEAEPYGVCKIVPPKNWKPPFALDLDKFTFPTKTQAIHQLQVRSAACDPDTFELEYNRFLEQHCGKKLRRRVVFEEDDLDLCKLFNAVKRYGGYDKVVKDKKWGEVCRFVWSVGKISECSKHVLSQLYREHLYDYESYSNSQNKADKKCKRAMHDVGVRKSVQESDTTRSNKRLKNGSGDKVKEDKLEKEEVFDQICEQCNSGLHGEVMLLCDRCNKGWHIYCLSPPLKQIPPGNWYCLECVNSDKDSFGFVPGKRFSLETFRRLAERAKKKWFGSTSPSRVQLEKKFWEIVDGSVGEVDVLYGNDLDTSKYGSGFPRNCDSRPPSVEIEEWDKYSSSPWNLNNLPKLEGSMLQAVHNNIAGVMVPWLYVGMLFSSFCWHFEDHCFYSINYLHWGEPKCWYSVPGGEAQAFEQVMRKSLPDLFDAQPDLLFQLVTMLNPTVLQENGVPVYTVLQEPGNFVITFPRSFHGGFNLGLNCAEAVNFAPADWLPHGGLGAELYRLYHKAAVLSHEELLCVVAKRNGCNDDVSPYLKKELLRIFNKEKTWRERLWRYGIVKSAQMSPRKHPEYVGTEEDPTCIICQQYLYLSAVECSCRPSAFVCLEHWRNLCECRPSKHRLLYRHTLAELNDLLLAIDKHSLEESPQSRTCRRQFLSSDDSNTLAKKVKSGRVTHAQLAEDWLLNSLKIFQSPFSNAAYVNALKEVEQFLWAGAEMDPVRDLAKNLVDGKRWALDVRNCLSKVETWSDQQNSDAEKVNLGEVQKLLSFNHLPCNEPGHLKLKVYAEEASELLLEIKSALSVCSMMDELEKLYIKATKSPIHVEECGRLAGEISSAEVWIDSVDQFFSVKNPRKMEIDDLHKLYFQMLELRVQLPEMELLLDMLEQADSWKTRCNEMLKGPLRLKARCTQMPLDYIQQLMSDAIVLQIEKEKLFVDMSGVLAAAISWEERAKRVLGTVAEMSEFEDVFRASEKIFMILPSLHEVKDVFLSAKSWLRRCQNFLSGKSSSSLLKVDALKEVIAQSKHLKVSLEEPEMLQRVLKEYEAWEHEAHTLLGCAESLLDTCDIVSAVNNDFMDKTTQLLDRFQSATKAGLSLGFDFPEMYKLQSASAKLQWCLKAISFCSKVPLLEEVEVLLEDAKCLSIACTCNNLESSLINGARWLRKALAVLSKSSLQKRCKLTDVEETQEEAQGMKLPFPEVVAQLVNAIEEHKSWQEKVHMFFNSRSGKQSYTALLQLKDLGDSVAFDSLELDLIASESGKVEKWILCCKEVIELVVGEMKPLRSSLLTIEQNLDRSLHIYQDLKGCRINNKLPYMCCASDSGEQDVLACSICKDRYHFACMDSRLAHTNKYTCPYCLFMESGAVSRNGRINKILRGKRNELKILVELVSAAKEFCIRIEETEMLEHVVKQALDCKSFLTEIVDDVLVYVDKDLSSVSNKLLTLLKGSAINMPSEDFFVKKLTEVKCIGLQWSDKAKKVASDCGELGLDEVFKTIAEGESLPVHPEKELKFYCSGSRQTYYVVVFMGMSTDFDSVGPQTPSPRSSKSKQRRKSSSKLNQKMLVVTDLSYILRNSNGIDQLWWRNRKPLKRTSRKRVKLDSLSPFFHLQL